MNDSVLLVEEEANRLKELSAQHDPYETGGILLGVLSDRVPWVTQVVEVPPAHPNRTRYDLPAGATHSLVEVARAIDPRLGYIGDWHSHPAAAGASGLDLRSLARLAAIATRHHEPPPLLIVAERYRDCWVLEARVGRWPRTRELRVLLTGPPEPDEQKQAILHEGTAES